jgi:hypothetical protein
MKTKTQKIIQEIKAIQAWDRIEFHGNRKKVGTIEVKEYIQIVLKKRQRSINKSSEQLYYSPAQRVRELIKWSLECTNTNYFKIMIEGHTGIYYAHPTYLHSDYNKTRLFDKNESTLKLMNLFNLIINKRK